MFLGRLRLLGVEPGLELFDFPGGLDLGFLGARHDLGGFGMARLSGFPNLDGVCEGGAQIGRRLGGRGDGFQSRRVRRNDM